MAALGGLLAACGAGTHAAVSSSPAKPVRGGRLRVASAAGGPTDTMDPGKAASGMDFYRTLNLFDSLVSLSPQVEPVLQLAESVEPNADATVWTVKLRPGVVFHNGSALTADDVIYTLQRNAKLLLTGLYATMIIDLPNLKKIDTLTVRIPLLRARGDFINDLSGIAIVQNGATDFTRPVGTGPFEFVSWTPGQGSVFKANTNYWGGTPYLDELVLSTISDSGARVNALLAGQVDAIDQVPYAQAKQYQGSAALTLLRSAPGNFVPMTMACDTPPFDDVRVRQAMRLIADRPALVAAAQFGFGEIGNDLAGLGLPSYADHLPQRQQDIGQARSLLKAAGRSDLAVTLASSSVAPGMLESATVFQQQAKQAGVTVTINNVPAADYYGPGYLKYGFGQSSWTAAPVTQFMSGALAAGAPFNETHWNDKEFNAVYEQARATLDPSVRTERLAAAQQILYDRGGYLIWGFSPYLDAVSSKVHPAAASATFPLAGGRFNTFWMG